MAAIDFPNSPSVNDTFSTAGKTWLYNGVSWTLVGVSTSNLQGPSGPSGPSGANGTTGATGATGSDPVVQSMMYR